MFNFIEKLNYEPIKKKSLNIKLKRPSAGINNFNDYIIVFNDEIKIYSRKCDHQGGKLIFKDNQIICPLHSWKFDALKGSYSNGLKKKLLIIKLSMMKF